MRVPEERKRRFIQGLLGLAALGASFLLSTCTDSTTLVQPEAYEGQGLIIPGEGMEGIRLGDTWETVLGRLGEHPHLNLIRFKYGAWTAYSWDDGPGVGLLIYFLLAKTGYGPVDGIMARGYRGVTPQGIGIGTPLTLVRQVYGPPDTSTVYSLDTSITDYYCIGGKQFRVYYRDSVVSNLFIGYYRPLTQDPMYRCE